MLALILGFFNKLIYKIKYRGKVMFDGIPGVISRMPIYVQAGEVKTGKHFNIKKGVYIAAVNGGKIIIGDNVSINRNCILVCHDMISIGNDVQIGPNTIFYDHDHNFNYFGIEKGYKKAPIIIDNNVWIGAGVTVLRGTHIGEGAVIGAGTVLYGEIPAHSLVSQNRELKITPIEIKE